MTSTIVEAPKWLPSHMATYAGTSLYEYREFPDICLYYNPLAGEAMQNYYSLEITPGNGNEILHRQKEVQSNATQYMSKKFEEFSRVNLIEVAEPFGDGALPLLLDAFDKKKLGSYIAVSPDKGINDAAIGFLKRIGMDFYGKLQTHADVVVEVESNTFGIQIRDALGSSYDSTTVNVFTLMNSRLGNSPDPRLMLKNIYDSMETGDYFALQQGIYRSGSEERLVRDYTTLFSTPNVFVGAKEIGSSLSPEQDKQSMFRVYWDEDFSGVKAYVTPDRDVSFLNVDLKAGEKIDLFRSKRFQETELKNILKLTGFKIEGVFFDSDEDNALYILKK